MATSTPRRQRWATGCLVVVGALACLGVGTTAYVGRYIARSSPRLLEGLAPRGESELVYALSPDQQAVVAERGNPPGFSLLFYAASDADAASTPMRQEVWSYPAEGVELSFLNGALVDTAEITDPASGLVPAPYRPEQFVAGMSFQQVVDATRLDTAVVIPLEPELVSEGEMYFTDQLILGLKNRRLQYVEALPLGEGG